MADPQHDDEILEIAIAKEVEAYNFYLAMANCVADERISVAFDELAKEELEHKARLELEVIKTGKTIAVEENPVRPDRNYILSNDPSPLDIDYKDLLLLAIEKEDAAFRTYVNLASSIKNEKSRDVLLVLAEEEIRHKLRFKTEYDILLKNR